MAKWSLLVWICVLPLQGCALEETHPTVKHSTVNDSSLRVNPKYAAVDSHATNVPPAKARNLEELTHYLTAAYEQPRLKARAIYRWLAHNIAYDVEAFRANGGRGLDFTPAAVLKKRKSVCEGYAQLFLAMAKIAGLEATIVRGYSKGFGYYVGKKFDRTDHAWNAVKLEDTWQLLDATWGAGIVTNEIKFEKKFKDYYFCTPPELFIFDHLPEDPKWQLLEKPLSKEQFARLATIKPQQSEIRLEQPTEVFLNRGDSVNFSFYAPGVNMAIVVQDGGKKQENVVRLEQDSTTGRFYGKVKIEHKKIQVFGRYPGNELYDELIEYLGK